LGLVIALFEFEENKKALKKADVEKCPNGLGILSTYPI